MESDGNKVNLRRKESFGGHNEIEITNGSKLMHGFSGCTSRGLLIVELTSEVYAYLSIN
ncbi:hypothetical protein C5167_015023 [Papaver somniferum]|uniref:Uncharacterized protein n=1 Tax=Papaver somniferum TaxID=3469 RepID=A0A4Y7J4W2_PAPSO|nr:hypothetical protein C5167_015023 [Papaver somniferum]